MKKGYLLRSSNSVSNLFAIFAGFMYFGIMAAGIAYFLDFFFGIWAVVADLCVFTVLFGIYVYIVFNCGFYIVETKIIHRGIFKKKEIPLESIAAIKVVHEFYKADCSTGRGVDFRAVFDENGNPLFVMYFLKETDNEMNSKIWDSIHFERKFSKNIIFQCVYDEELLQYLILLNPNIQRM